MRQNEDLVLVGQRTVLVPYKKEHVLQYHEWMKSPFLQEMTASEPLTLEEEYEMQQSWHEDDKKCTFILMAHPEKDTCQNIPVKEIKETAVMMGDVNIFLNDPDDDPSFGEIEIMIAEEAYRRTGRGLEALEVMMGYAIKELGIRTFHAKIAMSNQASIDLFTNKLGFYPVSISTVFQETTLEWSIHSPTKEQLTKDSEEEPYGSKATDTQKEIVLSVHQRLFSTWETHVQKKSWS
ncbi:GNAT domain-containing protein [Spinellus fusiger]|nr:GNAT domain-containing protein [Spinellus fusiger]